MGGTTKDAYAPERTRYLGDWVNRAACREIPDFDQLPEHRAKWICRDCPVLRDCGRWAINSHTHVDDPEHVIAGMTRNQRNQVRIELIRRQVATKPPKRCSRCEETKPALEFYISPTSKTGLTSECIACRKEADRLRKQRGGEKHCPACDTTKQLNEFGVDKRNPDGRNTRCKQCRREEKVRLRTIRGLPTKAPARKQVAA